MTSESGTPAQHLRAGLAPRDPAEPGRGSTSLELFLDLVFAAAVGLASSSFDSAVLQGCLGASLAGYAMVFFAIWWAWMNFTWFSSAYDCDDAAYRLTTLVQMAGVLVLAAGVPDAMAGQNFALIVTGYVVMRIAMISQWLRAAAADPPRRHLAVAYAVGIAVVQLGWVTWLFIPGTWAPALFVVFAVLELSVPVIAEHQAATPWHGGHIADRYGSFTLIVLGGTVVAATNAVIIASNGISHVARSSSSRQAGWYSPDRCGGCTSTGPSTICSPIWPRRCAGGTVITSSSPLSRPSRWESKSYWTTTSVAPRCRIRPPRLSSRCRQQCL